MKMPRVCKAAIAFACDGSVVANVHGFAGETHPKALLRRAIELGGEISSGSGCEGVRLATHRIDDAGHEGAGAAFVARKRRRKRKVEKASSKKRR